MIPALLFCAALLPLLASCSLFNQELPNEPPRLQLSQADTTQVGRGGRVSLRVRAADEDDDPLSYSWTSFGEGNFTDSTSNITEWIAPDQINGSSEFFLLSLTISDHQPTTEDPTQTFLIEVVQRPPSVAVVADTTISFSAPFAELQAVGADPENDKLEYTWEQLAGFTAQPQTERLDNQHTRVRFIPLLPGDYLYAVRVSDGADTASAQVLVRVPEPPLPPLTGAVPRQLSRPDGSLHPYQIDLYEYPNQRGAKPATASSFFRAVELCALQGGRLCRAEEWQGACQGADLRSYSSTDNPADLGEDNFGLRFCNTPNSLIATDEPDIVFLSVFLAEGGQFTNCATEGVYDLTGNVAEWVWADSSQQAATYTLSSVIEARECGEFAAPLPALPEGFDFSTQAINALSADATYQEYFRDNVGFRCCRQ
jgi:hypothetical protein